MAMRVAVYARVSTEAQEARGTIGSQIAALRERADAECHELVAEFVDDGHSGARLDRPDLDALRDAAEAGLLDAVWCLSPDRLARVYAHQVIVLDELARHGVAVLFADAPTLDDDPQARLLTQVQGVIAEYERAKMEAHRDKAPLAPGETCPDTSLLSPGRLEEGGRVTLQHVLCAGARQLPKARARELPAQRREFSHLRAVPLAKGSVAVEHPGPDVPGRAQQGVAAAALGRGGAQGDPGGAVDLPNGTHVRTSSEGYRHKTAHFRAPEEKTFSR
jgi:hypothetical protein